MSNAISFRRGVSDLGKADFIDYLHREAPLFQDPAGFWVASRFDDVRRILLDHTRFSSSAMGGGSVGFPLLTDDPPRHSVLRSLLSKAFTPASIEALRPRVERLAADLADAIEPGTDVDIVEAFTTPLPVAVIAGMLGVPEDAHHSFKRWSNAIVGIQDAPMSRERLGALTELREFFAELVKRRREAPGQDLISAMLRAQDTEETLSEEQVIGFAILLMIAGNETTTNLLGNLLDRLSRAPEVWTQLRASPDQVEPAIEESLRIDSPAQLVMRRARTTVRMAEHEIPEGALVLVYLAAANRDPSKWEEVDRFDPERRSERHIAFGHGVHTCIGAPLARLEASVAMHTLLDRFAKIAPGSGPRERLITSVLFGFRHLSLRLE